MKKIKDKRGAELPKANLSFAPFVNYLTEIYTGEKGLRKQYIKDTIDQFNNSTNDLTGDPETRTKTLFQLTDQALSFKPEVDVLSFDLYTSPALNELLYLKEELPGILSGKKERETFIKCIGKQVIGQTAVLSALCYRAIWGHYVQFPCLLLKDTTLSYESASTGQCWYFNLTADFRNIHIDSTFSAEHCRSLISEIDDYVLSEEETLDQLKKKLPLTEFTFTGFGKFSVVDITFTHIIRSIDQQVDSPSFSTQNGAYFKDVRNALNVVAGNNKLKFGLLPLFQLNGKFLFSETYTGDTVDPESQKNLFDFLINVYRLKPYRVYLKEIDEELTAKYLYLKAHKKNGIQSFALLPIFFHEKLVGALEVLAKDRADLTKGILAKLESFFPVLGTIFDRSVQKLQNTIDDVIRTKFTSLQPSVQWRFNQAAWQYLQNCKNTFEPVEIEDIEFNQVYPMYGSIDIKNSTIKRNRALRQDSVFHLTLLQQTLAKLKECTLFSLLDEKISECKKWQAILDKESEDLPEGELNYFFEHTVYNFLKELSISKPEIDPITSVYFCALDDKNGRATENQRKLEHSMTMVISVINDLVDKLDRQAQNDFPCFFEKFRTDGVEYDIYSGQSIAPDRPFNAIIIKNLRFLQLTNMISIANRTQQLQQNLPVPVEVTLLIFVNPNNIDIRFRRDERRFDVEGAYNIRYHIVKKRIDKVLIKNTTERLTVPGKIAIVYTNQKEADDYLVHIRYLQTQGLIDDQIELLELEQLQGVIGLKAIRVAVRYNNAVEH